MYLAGAFICLVAIWIWRSPWRRGAHGEARVNSSLAYHLDEREYRILKDLTLPTRNGTTQIDHIVVSRFGVFVIETKNMSGWIFGKADQRLWTQTIYRKKSSFQNPIQQNYKHVKTVQELLNLRSDQVFNVVAFVGSGTARTMMPPNVVWSTEALAAYIRSKQWPVLAEEDVDRLVERLFQSRLQPGIRTRHAHIKHVKTQIASRQRDKTMCPRCGAALIERINSKSGERFLACTRFPKCRGTRSLY